MDRPHHLGFRCVTGGVSRVAKGTDGHQLALLSFHRGARDRWVGRIPEQQFRGLRLVANNTRFLILPGARVPKLVSRILSRSPRQISSDTEAATGHPVLPAKTFVDPDGSRGSAIMPRTGPHPRPIWHQYSENRLRSA